MSSLILLFSLLVPATGAVSAQPEESRMWMTVGERRFVITLADNATALQGFELTADEQTRVVESYLAGVRAKAEDGR